MTISKTWETPQLMCLERSHFAVNGTLPAGGNPVSILPALCANPIPDVHAALIDFPMVEDTPTIKPPWRRFFALSDFRFIFSHGGGMLIPVATRNCGARPRAWRPDERAVKLPDGADYELKRQYYDLASIRFNRAGIAGLRKLLLISQLRYGSDEPFNSTIAINKSLQRIDLSLPRCSRDERTNCDTLVPPVANLIDNVVRRRQGRVKLTLIRPQVNIPRCPPHGHSGGQRRYSALYADTPRVRGASDRNDYSAASAAVTFGGNSVVVPASLSTIISKSK